MAHPSGRLVSAAPVGWGLGDCGVLPGEYMRGTSKLPCSRLADRAAGCGCAVCAVCLDVRFWQWQRGNRRYGQAVRASRPGRGGDGRLCMSSHCLRRSSARAHSGALDPVQVHQRGAHPLSPPHLGMRRHRRSPLRDSPVRPPAAVGPRRYCPGGRGTSNHPPEWIAARKLPRHLWDRASASIRMDSKH